MMDITLPSSAVPIMCPLVASFLYILHVVTKDTEVRFIVKDVRKAKGRTREVKSKIPSEWISV
jgi:hypothetical protein